MTLVCDGGAAPLAPSAAAAASGGPRAVVEALLAAARADAPAALGLVVDTVGSTYAKSGAVLCIGGAGRVGWISGGCLESSLEASTQALIAAGRAGLIEYDTRDDADLFVGSGIGCRGVVRIAVIPLAALSGIAQALQVWIDQGRALAIELEAGGALGLSTGTDAMRWPLAWSETVAVASGSTYALELAAAPRVLVAGAGPESDRLVPWLRQLGWYVDVVERRPRWAAAAAAADRHLTLTVGTALARSRYDAALVMNHDFELDRDALEQLAGASVPWIGLLGPPARRDDLLRLLGAALADALRPRLHAPVGLDLGGRGPESIALAIVAQLHAWRHRGG
ncbi:MAG: XshC-Cox1-family protein [Rhodanobacter denitrificans]|uniref:XshC-Cox1-family protein n=1 Tax=Rhodanobacter denitrificans TaxID=666685 RepID=A0A2W5KNB8_9GAMM|nr:MAG: XshC-Cox1-family protein [Rhodanobacter denitrificans]